MNKAAKKRIIILSAAMAGLLAVGGIATGVMTSMSGYMDQFFPGEKVITDTGEGIKDTTYIDFKTNSKEEALANAQAKTLQTAEEGMVLLKNKANALPLAATTKLTVLGYYSWHNNMSGGEDPATTSGAISLGKGLENGFTTNPEVNAIYASLNAEIPEADVETKLNAAASTFSEYDTAVVTIKRNSGEGNDQVMDSGVSENHRTGLTINRAEMKLIDYANKHFNKVIILINSANTMELGFLDDNDPHMSAAGIYTDPYSETTVDCSKIVGAFWVGCCGSQGGTAIANLLKGAANPSGHTPDIYARTLRNDPTYVNFGDFEYTNGASLGSYATRTYFLEYEENIYSGYRYYETAAKEAEKGNYAGYEYDKAVVYPFGYGLSYTTFKYEYDGDYVYDATAQEFTFKVKVTNTGSVKGKGVAQIYVECPWEAGQVEKSEVTLAGFAKTKILEPGASETVTIVVKRDYFTSYDFRGEKAYLLDKGTYTFYLSSDEKGSHCWADAATPKQTWNLDNKIVFNGSNKRVTDEKVATNVMDDELNYKFKTYEEGSTGDGFAHDMSRKDFKASFPTAPTGEDYLVKDERAKKQIAKYDVWAESEQNGTDINGNKITEMPVTESKKTSYVLADMRGVDFDDKKWDEYIDQFSVDSMAYMFSNGGWQAPADEDNGVPKTWDTDSPYGYYGHALTISGVNIWYCGAPMVAATFNTELAKELGEAFAEEAWNQKQKDGAPITGLYGYGMNQHRSAFGGRNYEYYSEDVVLCGKMGAAEASAASEKGLITYMKHFVLNDQELHRQDNGYCSYINEQAFREVSLRAWEIYMKEAKMDIKYNGTNASGTYEIMHKDMSAATGIMTCYNRIGATYGGASVSINGILRNEWNFTGTVLTDAGGEPDTYMTTDLALRRGQNLTLTNNGTQGLFDTESATAVYWLKRSTRHLLYNKANSNIMQGVAPGASFYYKTAPWVTGLVVAWSVLAAMTVATVAVDVLLAKGVIKVKEKEAVASDSDDEY
ncbi:MAG: glycoside hydrolase family 3 C-terminal domain-containing protein [Bacilli bacterium]|nr:glycoside hydrolase family 3 C-terminal domain-containing protein [Bacilli bacterium]